MACGLLVARHGFSFATKSLKRYYIKASSGAFVQWYNALVHTSSTRWVHRSPEGYINNTHEASMTPASHFISLSRSGEKVHACVRMYLVNFSSLRQGG